MALVKLQTSLGTIQIELDEKATPKTTANFLKYVNAGFYDGTVFHRVIKGFMIQGGGFEPGMMQKLAQAPIINEAKTGLKNEDWHHCHGANERSPFCVCSVFYQCC